MTDLSADVDALAAQTGFSGGVAVLRGGETVFETAYGLADRALGLRNTVDTRFGIASGVKGLTALAVMSLISDGVLSLGTTARSVLGPDLPLVDDSVTVEHLLSHRSGIGDYVDEETEGEITDYVLPVPVHQLVDTENYLTVLGGHPAKFAPDARFSYCNSGYVVLALIAERAAREPFRELVRARVCEPAGMDATGFPRSDELPRDAARGYLPIDGVDRTNVFHLPVRGSGDGGAYSTTADFGRFWPALLGGSIVPEPMVGRMLERRSDAGDGMGYGLGFWLRDADGAVVLEGYDAGVSFRSWHRRASGTTVTVVSNTSEGAWPIARLLAELTA